MSDRAKYRLSLSSVVLGAGFVLLDLLLAAAWTAAR